MTGVQTCALPISDLVVMNTDIFALPAAELENAKPVMTVFAGRPVYRDISFGGVPARKAAVTVEEREDGHGH